MTAIFIIMAVALMFAGLGTAIRFYRCYWLISGYNTMSKEKQKNVDTEGLGKLMGNFCFFLSAVVLLMGVAILLRNDALILACISSTVASTVFTVIRAQRYDRNAQNDDGTMTRDTKIALAFICAVMAAVLAFVAYMICSR